MHTKRYHQSSPSGELATSNSPNTHQITSESRHSAPSPETLTRAQFQNSINSSLDLNTNPRELGDTINSSFLNNSKLIPQSNRTTPDTHGGSEPGTRRNIDRHWARFQIALINRQTSTTNHQQEDERQTINSEENRVSDHSYAELESGEEFFAPKIQDSRFKIFFSNKLQALGGP